MVQILYILAFTVLSIFAISNLIRSMISLSQNESRNYQSNRRRVSPQFNHPELWDKDGQYIDEPLMVVKSINVDDARSRLDALYNSSPSTDK
ncbi:MAG: hypothetical protein AUK48_15740 [Oscillatoriales cyanobacterium CG2_30_44_21]|nr:MAG: hypothetical protein AUK48_15740 [Oscillatoriales cyanobacterium CG2_30_44_21]